MTAESGVQISFSGNDGDFTADTNTVVQLNDARVFVDGDWKVRGAINAGTSTVTMSGTTTQTMDQPYEPFYVLELAGTGTKTIQAASVLHALEVTGTGVTLQTGNNLTIKSTAVHTAYVGELPADITITGDAIVERYVNASERSWYHLASAVNGATVDDWQNEIPITGSFLGHSNLGGSNGTSVYGYNESENSTSNEDGWLAFPAAGSDSLVTIANGKGYRFYLRQNVSNPLGGVTIDGKGTLNAGNKTMPVSFTSSGVLAADGWNLVGNPYASTIDWYDPSWTKVGLDDAMYVWDGTLKRYASFVGDVGINGGSRFVPSGQAFWVKANAANPSLVARQTVKSNGQPTLLKPQSTSNVIRLTLKDGADQTENVVRFVSDATNAFDEAYDAHFFYDNYPLKMCSYNSDGKYYSINALEEDGDLDIPLWMDVPTVNHQYTLTVSGVASYTLMEDLVLRDLYLGTETVLEEDISYDFYVDTDKSSSAANRFVLGKTSVLTSSVESVFSTVSIFPNPASVGKVQVITRKVIEDVRVYGGDGHTHSVTFKRGQETMVELDAAQLAKGVYVLEVEFEDGTSAFEKLVIE